MLRAPWRKLWIAAQYHQFSGREFKQTPGDSGGQRSLACCSPWGGKESAMAQRLNNSHTQPLLKEFKTYIPQRISEMKSALKNVYRRYFQNFESLRALCQRSPVRRASSWLGRGGARLAVACWDHGPTHCVPSTGEPRNRKLQVSDRKEWVPERLRSLLELLNK